MKLGIIDYMDCAHYIPDHDRCGGLHGHTYKVEVVIEGSPEGKMIMDFHDLKKTVKKVLGDFDHRTLNDILEYPSVENLCLELKKKLGSVLDFQFKVRVWEGEGKWAEV